MNEAERSFPLEKEFDELLKKASPSDVESFVKQHPEVKFTKWRAYQPWLSGAVAIKRPEIVRLLLELGFSPNEDEGPPAFETPLSCALAQDSPELVRVLLEHGANPNGDPEFVRYPLSAVTKTKHALEYIKLLEQYGAELDRDYMHKGMRKWVNALSMAEIWGQQEVVKYLRDKGCKTPEEKSAARDTATQEIGAAERTPTRAEDVMDFFTETVGKPDVLSVQEIVPTGIPVAIHAIPPADDRPFVTLFTTGMAEHPMNVPDGAEEYARAELYIQLPPDWEYQEYEDPHWGWPQAWLRQMAQYPEQHDSWLGGPVTLVANGEPPEPLAPNTRFTTLLLLADRSLTTRDGEKIWFYRMTPLYTEERQLEIDHGVPALLNAFDKHDIPMVVDLDRKNVAT